MKFRLLILFLATVATAMSHHLERVWTDEKGRKTKAELLKIEYVTAYGKKGKGGRAIGTDIKLGSLRSFMLQPYSSFTGNAQVNYGCGLLISNYFFHMDREEDGARIKNFLKALNAGKQGDEALAVLLDGQTWQELEADIAKAYSRKGVDFTFSE